MPLSLASNALTTAEAVYAELGLAVPGGGPSDRVLRLINSTSQQIENLLGRKLARKQFTLLSPEQLQGSGGIWLFVSRWPIEDVEQVSIDGGQLAEGDWGRSEDLDEKGILHRAAGWPRRTSVSPLTGEPHGDRGFNITVAYTGGYRLPHDDGEGIPLPADIEQACIDEVVLAYRAPRHSIIEETTVGGHRRKYAQAAGGMTGLSRSTRDFLLRYKRKFTGSPH